jgi:hypothetical protein
MSETNEASPAAESRDLQRLVSSYKDLQVAFMKHATHTFGCNKNRFGLINPECTCGLDDMRSAIRADLYGAHDC